MQRTRPLKTRLSGMGFVLIVTGLIFYIYGAFVFLIVLPEQELVSSITAARLAEIQAANSAAAAASDSSRRNLDSSDTKSKGSSLQSLVNQDLDSGISLSLNTDSMNPNMIEENVIFWGTITQDQYRYVYGLYVNYGGTVMLVIFHIFFILHLIAFYNAIMTDPGLVPSHWGFYMGDETKRRRYCKMCNVWKPDRTHHCSLCSRCILNMDHHCPWINNCVGFFNRKFFMQFVVYVWLCLFIVDVFSFPIILDKVILYCSLMLPEIGPGLKPDYHLTLQEHSRHLLMIFSYFLAVVLGCTLTNFMKFHIRLISDNFTTIEHLEREENAKSRYDIGVRRNWEQVFGSNLWAWWIPFHINASRPIGDGVRWRVHYTRVIDEDEELMGEDEGGGPSQTQNRRLLK